MGKAYLEAFIFCITSILFVLRFYASNQFFKILKILLTFLNVLSYFMYVYIYKGSEKVSSVLMQPL